MLFSMVSLASGLKEKEKKKEVNYKSVVEQPRLASLQVKCVNTMLGFATNTVYTLHLYLFIKQTCSLTFLITPGV